MNLVMFLYALEHVARICRVLRHPWGHALLVGVGGSGRQSLTKLAAGIEDYHIMEVEVTKAYSRSDWKDDLKVVPWPCWRLPVTVRHRTHATYRLLLVQGERHHCTCWQQLKETYPNTQAFAARRTF